MDARTFRTLPSAFAIAIAAVGSNSAFAQMSGTPVALLGASLEEYVQNSTSTDSSAGNGQTINNGYATATASYTGNDGSASVSIKPGSSDFEIARATATWSFFIAGPPGITNIPINVIGHGELIVANATAQDSILDMAQFYGTLPGFLYVETASSNVRNIFNVAYPGSISDNTPYQINFQAYAYSFGGKTPSITALADPVVQFVPGFDSTGLSIVSSPVISAVPEPSTSWLLLAGGLGLIAFRKFRSRPA